MPVVHLGRAINILLCERKEALTRTPKQDNRLHHTFMVSPEMWEKGLSLLHQNGSTAAEPIVYRENRPLITPSGTARAGESPSTLPQSSRCKASSRAKLLWEHRAALRRRRQ